MANHAIFNPADLTTRYFGGFYDLAPNGTNGNRRLYITTAGIIDAVYGEFQCTTPGSAEPISLFISLNSVSSTLFTATASMDATHNPFSGNPALAVVPGDWVEIQMNLPLFVTNPITVLGNATIHITGP